MGEKARDWRERIGDEIKTPGFWAIWNCIKDWEVIEVEVDMSSRDYGIKAQVSTSSGRALLILDALREAGLLETLNDI